MQPPRSLTALIVSVAGATVIYAQAGPYIGRTADPAPTKGPATPATPTRRLGEVTVPSMPRPVMFRLNGQAGVFNRPYLSVMFDLNGDGVFDADLERHLISEKFVNLGNTTYEFSVDADGKQISLTPTRHRPDRLSIKNGFRAPDFSFTDLAGKTRQLSDYRGKVVLLDFWATWCGPCVAAVPDMVALYDKYRARGFEIIGIEANDTPEKVLEFTAAHKMTWTQTLEKDKGVIGALYRIEGWPTAFLIGPDGRFVAANYRGEIDLREELEGLFPNVPLLTRTSRRDFPSRHTAATIRSERGARNGRAGR